MQIVTLETGKKWYSLIKRVNWLEIKVTDIEQAVSFYRDALGLKIKSEWSNYVVFDLAGTVTLALMLGGKKERREGAPNIYLAVENVDEEYERLKTKGVDFVEPPKKQYWGGYAALFADPDENLLYLTQTKD
jgi:predicted enzyme related to lactoylglutathione lyase